MGYVLGGVAALGLLVLLGYLFVSADPRSLVRTLRYTAGVGLVLVGAVLMLAGRLGLGMMLIAGGISAIVVGRIGPVDLGAGVRSAGQGSRVRSRYIEMTLDHDTGHMDGRVLGGRFAGSSLAGLSETDIVALHREIVTDAESVALLEAYLDRRKPGWREDFESNPAGRAAGAANASAMTDQQAYEILGLSPGVSEAEIRAAHRRLMKKVHPDQGGSTFLAARINEAKDWLLGNHR